MARFIEDFFKVPFSFLFNQSDIIDYGDSFYDATGQFYSIFFADEKNDDIDFYRSTAQRTGGPILEAACGTGRVAIPLTIDGHRVVGNDVSITMLTACSQKIQKEKKETKGTLLLCQSELQNLPFKNTFSLSIVPYNSFNHLLQTQEHSNAIAGLHRSLKKGGTLVMEILPYHKEYDTSLRLRKKGFIPNTKTKVSLYSRVEHNKEESTHTVYWYFKVDNENKKGDRIVTRFTRKDIRLKYLTGLLNNSGFDVVKVMYGYKEEAGDSLKRIIIAEKVG